MTNGKDPWADAANQAVGALYKHYLTKPSEAEMQAVRLKAQMGQADLQKTRLGNQMTSRRLNLGDYALDGLPAPIQNKLYRDSLGGDRSATQIFDSYVRPNQQVDVGDTKYISSGVTGAPIQEYGVGVAPTTKIQDDRIVTAPGVPSGNRPSMLPPELVQAVKMRESGGDPNALSPVGAAGLMQIMPDTARDPGYGVQPLQGWDGKDPRTAPPEEQMRFGEEYLAAMIRERGSVEEGLAAYNAGPGAVQEYGGIPPYEETQNYVQNIMGDLQGGPQVTALPKSPTDIASEEENMRQKSVAANVVNTKFDEAMGELGFFNTGIPGTLLSKIPGSDAFDLSETLSTIRANLGFDKLQSMREASPTGGALGQVSEFENKLLQAVFGSLEQGQSDEQLKLNMMIAQDAYNDLIHGYDADGNPLGPQRHGVPSLRNVITAKGEADLNRIIMFYDNNNLEIPPLLQDGLVEKAMELGIQ